MDMFTATVTEVIISLNQHSLSTAQVYRIHLKLVEYKYQPPHLLLLMASLLVPTIRRTGIATFMGQTPIDKMVLPTQWLRQGLTIVHLSSMFVHDNIRRLERR